MDVNHLGFADNFFDVVVAQYVITAVPDPEAALDEFARVLQARRRNRPGQPYRRREGAAPQFRAWLCAGGAPARLAAGISLGAPATIWIDGRRDLRVLERTPMPPLGHFSLIRFGKAAA